MAKNILIILSFTMLLNINAQNISVGISTNLMGGNISEPISQNGIISNIKSDWSVLQYGFGFRINVSDIYPFNLFISNNLLYGSKNKVFYNHIVDPRHFEYALESNINYFIAINNAFVISYSTFYKFEIGIGINTQIRFYEFSDTYNNISLNYDFNIEKKDLTTFNFGPTFRISRNISKFIKLELGTSYYVLNDNYNSVRIRADEIVSIDYYYAKKRIDQIEYFLNIMYNF